jgi:hypothetical protein
MVTQAKKKRRKLFPPKYGARFRYTLLESTLIICNDSTNFKSIKMLLQNKAAKTLCLQLKKSN